MSRIIDTAWFPNRRQAEKYVREKVGKNKGKQVKIYPAGDYRGAGWSVRIEEVEENA